MKILITGGSGYLGRALTEHFVADFDDVLWVSRDTDVACPQGVTVLSYDELRTSDEVFDVIINLAGAGIADKRWSDKRKQALFASRLKPTQAVLDYVARIADKPKLLINASAIGWYGKQPIVSHETINQQTVAVVDTEENKVKNKPKNKLINEQVLTEDSPFVTDDFAHQLCDKWEQLALTATDMGVPVAIIRIGVVLSKQGGMIDKLKLPFSLGLGGRLGDGKQIMSWISRDDLVRAIVFIIEQNMLMDSDLSLPNRQHKQQLYNLTAPNPVTNSEFTKAVGRWLNRPTIFAQPRSLVKLIFGEMATLLIDGQNVYPQRLLEMGFKFEHERVEECFE